MLAPSNPVKTAPTENPSERDLANIRHAIFQAEQGLSERGVPIGAALVRSDGVVIGVGRNRRVQQNSAILHGETDCLNNIGRLPASVYKDCTTLSPCSMCSGTMVLFGIKRCVMGENDTFVGARGADALFASAGVEVVNLNLDSCKKLMNEFIERFPEVWNEDIGEEDSK
ncbi:cytosine deaminase [Rhodotorula diobovata]|uniref:Cytosine deaminase n=1 Tax=Rhodotorula diobovata TaxID=5288 RepID=A0A5C5G5M0_9BASI|nr:cytosine deaminase [Rhodotorula diobovata]